MITSLSVGLLLSPVSKIEAVKRPPCEQRLHFRGNVASARRVLNDTPDVVKQLLGGTFTQMKFVITFHCCCRHRRFQWIFIQTVLTFWWHFCFRWHKYCLQIQFHLQALQHPLFSVAFTGNTVSTTSLSLPAFESIPVSAVCSNEGVLFRPCRTWEATW